MPTYSTVPTTLVAKLLADHPATRSELDAIRDPRVPSRFQGVYPHRHGGATRGSSRYKINSFRARVLKFFELGSGFPSAEDAARAVVAFYKATYGIHWQRVFRYRKVTPWRVRPVFQRNRFIGFAADIYVRGILVGVTYAEAYGRERGARDKWIWASAADAKRAARLAMDRLFDRERELLTVPHPGLLFWRG